MIILEIIVFGWTFIRLGPEDNVAEYYQQQVEMLEGFNEMDALAERGFVPGMTKVYVAMSLSIFYEHDALSLLFKLKLLIVVTGRAGKFG